MKAGFCERDITPSIEMEQPGGYGKAYIIKIRDPLKVQASVFDDGKEKVALVGIDTCTIQPSQVVEEIREKVEAACGIKKDHIMIAASHTHEGGPLFGQLPERFRDAPPLVKDLAINHSTIADPLYCKLVIRQVVSAICEAEQNKMDALLSVGSGCEDKVYYNRRFKMKNGRTYTHPGKCNPDIIEPAGPIDPEVGVLATWTPDGKLLGVIVNFACHGTTMQTVNGTSADWVYFLERTIKGVYGKEANVVFLNGACDDVTQVDNLSSQEPEFGERWSRLVGQSVGAQALKVLASAFTGEMELIKTVSETIQIKRRKPCKKHLKRSLEILEKHPKGSIEWTFAKEIVVLDYLIKKEPKVDVEIQAIQIGPVVFLSNPAEYFCQLGLDIKKKRDPVIGGGCHAIDLLRWICGEVKEVCAYGSHKMLKDWDIPYDTVIASLKFLNNDIIGKVMVSISVKRPYTMRSVFYGSEGTIIADNTSPHIQVYTTKSPMKLEFAKVPVNIASHNISAEIEYFLKVLLDGKHLEVDVIEGANTVATALAITESAKNNGMPANVNLYI